jgi:3-hydroxybutyryl-CoA dehydrogenase
MGRGIALAAALAERATVVVDLKERTDPEHEQVGASVQAELTRDLGFLADLDLLSAERSRRLASLVNVTTARAAVGRLGVCEIVFEAVPETMAAKRAAFEWISTHAAPTAIVASTTSTLNVDELAQLAPHPERFLNAHWLNPAHLMPLVEIAVGRATAPETTQRMRAALEAMGKVPVVCSASPGYIVPRIQALAMNEAARLVEEGVASAEDVDTAVRAGFGLRFAVLGLLEFIDWGGNDILYYASGHLSRTIDADRYRVPAIVERNMREGRNGVREGSGFYEYANVDVEAYRRERLTRFVELVRHVGLLPPGLDGANTRTSAALRGRDDLSESGQSPPSRSS